MTFLALVGGRLEPPLRNSQAFLDALAAFALRAAWRKASSGCVASWCTILGDRTYSVRQ